MIAYIGGLIRAFAHDRVGVVLALLAPITFFTLIGSFYVHLERQDGVQVIVLVRDISSTEDGRRLSDSIRRCAEPPIVVRDAMESAAEDPASVASILLAPGFRVDGGTVRVRAEVPFPGGASLVRQLVETAWHAEFGAKDLAPSIEASSIPGRLLRDATAGVCVIFVMFALSALVSRGLADDAAGLMARLRSAGFGDLSITIARCSVMTLIGAAQIGVTLVWAAVFFGIVPRAPFAMLMAGLSGAFCISGFFALVAAVCGRRVRFAAVAPVLTLILSGLSGAFIPRFLLPEEVSRIGGMLFPAWMIDASRAAIEGGLDSVRILGLCLTGSAYVLGAAVISRWTRRA